MERYSWLKNGWFIPMILAYLITITFFAAFIATQKRYMDDQPYTFLPSITHVQTKVSLK